MPPRVGSRYSASLGVLDAEGRRFLTEREPFRFREYEDTRKHVVVQGDSLFTLAGRYFAPVPRACGFWWAIADFQPEPVFDPTLELELGRRIYVPSVRVLTDVMLGADGARS